MGSQTARGSSSASHLRGEDVAFSSTEEIGTSEFDPFLCSIPSPWSPLVDQQTNGAGVQWTFKKSSTTDRNLSGLSICMAWLALGITTVCGKLRHFRISS
jgi:hypothetical protein